MDCNFRYKKESTSFHYITMEPIEPVITMHCSLQSGGVCDEDKCIFMIQLKILQELKDKLRE